VDKRKNKKESSQMKHKGWKPDTPDFRDRKYKSIKPKALKAANLPSNFSLQSQMPPIIDQGELGSCTGCSISAVLMFNRMKTKEKPHFRPSRLFIYYNERAIEKTINTDAGAEIRTGIKTVNKQGFCDEKLWPYDIARFKKKPALSAYKNAQMYKSLEYYRLDNKNITELKTCLVSGFPFVFGFTTYSSLEQAENNKGIIPFPSQSDSVDGGHAVVCCGYDDNSKLFQIHNSWGTSYGDKGYYYLPYDYMTNTDLSDDFWTIRSINEKDNIK
jgi:C1A family cysteine protease